MTMPCQGTRFETAKLLCNSDAISPPLHCERVLRKAWLGCSGSYDSFEQMKMMLTAICQVLFLPCLYTE